MVLPIIWSAPSPQNGYTPLHCAAHGGHLECLQELLGAGADKEAEDKVRSKSRGGRTPQALRASVRSPLSYVLPPSLGARCFASVGGQLLASHNQRPPAI